MLIYQGKGVTIAGHDAARPWRIKTLFKVRDIHDPGWRSSKKIWLQYLKDRVSGVGLSTV